MTRLPLSDQLQDLGDLLGLPKLEWDEQQSCSLEFGDDAVVSMYLDEDSHDVTTYTVLGHLKASAPLSTWQQLMQANLFCSGTEGATLGFEPGNELIYLTRQLPVETLSPQRWLLALQGFVGASRKWQQQLALWNADTPDDASASSEHFSAAMRA